MFALLYFIALSAVVIFLVVEACDFLQDWT